MPAAKFQCRLGATLVELIVVVAIIGILAAVAIPLVSAYARDSRVSEAVGNVQGILEAESAFFVRFQRYTVNLGWCPDVQPPPAGSTQTWPNPDGNGLLPCGGNDIARREWVMLGWRPNSPLYFHYRVFSAYGLDGSNNVVPLFHPDSAGLNPPPSMTDGDDYMGNRASTFGVDWATEANPDPDGDGNVDANDMRPWCAVEAEADTDGDGHEVYIRANSINHQYEKIPNPRKHGGGPERAW